MHCDGVSLAVAGDGDLREHRASGDLGQGREPVSLHARPSPLAGAPGREIMERGVAPQPGRPGHAVRQLLQLLAGVSGIGTATGREIMGSRTRTASITQLFPNSVFAGPCTDPS